MLNSILNGPDQALGKPSIVLSTKHGPPFSPIKRKKPDYIRIDEGFVSSTIWLHNTNRSIPIVWVTMLLSADWTGRVIMTEADLADLSHVEMQECMEAIHFLASPDRYSEVKSHAGARIEVMDGGWKIHEFWRYAGERRHKLRKGQKAYREFLNSKFWKDLSGECIRRAGARCSRCRSRKHLQSHHLFYRDNWWETQIEDLECLCRKCHKLEHKYGSVSNGPEVTAGVL